MADNRVINFGLLATMLGVDRLNLATRLDYQALPEDDPLVTVDEIRGKLGRAFSNIDIQAVIDQCQPFVPDVVEEVDDLLEDIP